MDKCPRRPKHDRGKWIGGSAGIVASMQLLPVSVSLLLNLVFLIVTLPLALQIGSQFMPPLFEGSALFMPTALPGISIGQASQLLHEQDKIIRTFPEVETVFGCRARFARFLSQRRFPM